jgi:hypothetical protein
MGEDFVMSVLIIDEKTKPNWSLAKKEIMNNPKILEKMKTLEYDKKYMLMKLEWLKYAFEGKTNDAQIIRHNGELLLISGGMSYGDDPTDTFTAMTVLDEVGLIKTLGFRYE